MVTGCLGVLAVILSLSPGYLQTSPDLQKAIELTRGGKFQEAVPILLSLRREARQAYVVDFNLALCYVALRQYRPAIDLLSGLRSSGHDKENVENLLAQALLGNRQPVEAFAAFERAARAGPEDEKLYLYIAESSMANGYYDVGIRVVEAGLKHLPRSPRLVLEHGLLLARLDFPDEATKELQKVQELAPGSEVACIAEAQKSLMDGDVAGAVRAAREGVQMAKQDFMLLVLYGEAVLRSGAEPGSRDFVDACAALERAVALRPSDAGAQLALGKLYLVESRMDAAVEHLELARDLDANNPAVYSNLATAYRRHGDLSRAQEALATLARLNREEEERIRTAPGDRKAGYAGKPRTP